MDRRPLAALLLVVTLVACGSAQAVERTTTPGGRTGPTAWVGSVRWIDQELRQDPIGRNWHPGCPVPIRDLRLVTVSYWTFGGRVKQGPLIINVVGGARGFTGIPALAGFFWVYLFAVVTVLTVHRMVRSARGLAFLAVREDDLAAEVMGIDATRYKVTAFLVGSFFAGIAGGLFAHFDAYLHTNSFTFMRSIEIIVMVVLGGMGSISG